MSGRNTPYRIARTLVVTLALAPLAAACAGDAPVYLATAVAEDLPFIPGAFTPSEIASAWASGATFVKLFPASAVGPTFVRELRGPMPDAALIPTGGIDASNARSYPDAGAAAVGIGSAITRADPATRRAIVAAVALSVEAGANVAGANVAGANVAGANVAGTNVAGTNGAGSSPVTPGDPG